MSFRERSAWISLVVTPLIWGGYFWKIWPDIQDDGALNVRTVGMFIGTLVLLVIVQIVLATILATVAATLNRRTEEQPMDERDQLIDLKATRLGFYALSTLLIGVSSLWLLGMSPLVMANGILAAMVVAETLRSASIVFAYRRGR